MIPLTNEPIFTIHVICKGAYSVMGSQSDVVMIPFTGTADGPYFKGQILGTGVDTQKIPKGGKAFLSARYMLEGVDYEGQMCRVFIENQGDDMNCCKPVIVTDSKALAEFEDMPLRAVVEPAEGGVTVKIYKEDTLWHQSV